KLGSTTCEPDGLHAVSFREAGLSVRQPARPWPCAKAGTAFSSSTNKSAQPGSVAGIGDAGGRSTQRSRDRRSRLQYKQKRPAEAGRFEFQTKLLNVKGSGLSRYRRCCK